MEHVSSARKVNLCSPSGYWRSHLWRSINTNCQLLRCKLTKKIKENKQGVVYKDNLSTKIFISWQKRFKNPHKTSKNFIFLAPSNRTASHTPVSCTTTYTSLLKYGANSNFCATLDMGSKTQEQPISIYQGSTKRRQTFEMSLQMGYGLHWTQGNRPCREATSKPRLILLLIYSFSWRMQCKKNIGDLATFIL